MHSQLVRQSSAQYIPDQRSGTDNSDDEREFDAIVVVDKLVKALDEHSFRSDDFAEFQ